jgi:CubicO group peptidase (beta-lactamase class C family)
MQTPPYPFVMDSYGGVWGLGVRVIFPRETAILPIGSFGWSGAYGTHFWVDPENGIVAVYLKNSQYDGGSEARTARNFEVDVMASFEA